MLFYTLKRFGLASLVALTVSFISFGLLYLSSDPAIAMAGETASDADIEAIRKLYGFDRPILVQYFDWLQRAIGGDLGKSYYFRTDVSALIGERLPTTMMLGLAQLPLQFYSQFRLVLLLQFVQTALLTALRCSYRLWGRRFPAFGLP